MNYDTTLAYWIQSHGWIGTISLIVIIATLLYIIFIVKRIIPNEDKITK